MAPAITNNKGILAVGLASVLAVAGASNIPSSANSKPEVEPTPKSPTHGPVENSLSNFTLPEPPLGEPPPLELGPEYKCSPEQLVKYREGVLDLNLEASYLRGVIDPIVSKMKYEEYEDLGKYLQYPHLSKAFMGGNRIKIDDISTDTLQGMRELWLRAAIIDKDLKRFEGKLEILKQELSKPDFYRPGFEEKLQKYAVEFKESEIKGITQSFAKDLGLFMLKNGVEAKKLSDRKAAIMTALKK